MYRCQNRCPDLVLPPPPDVSAHIELVLGQLVLAQHVVKLVHGQTHQGLQEIIDSRYLEVDKWASHPDGEGQAGLLGELLVLAQPPGVPGRGARAEAGPDLGESVLLLVTASQAAAGAGGASGAAIG